MIARRAVLAGGGLAVLAALSGCGFHPVYGAGQPATAQLAAVYVDLIPNRSGQLLRQALQQRLEGDGSTSAKRFSLQVVFAESSQGLDVQADNSTTRTRDVGTARWSLHPVDDPSQVLASGFVRSLDGFNVIDEQFFYADLQEDSVQHRLAQNLAEQIALAMSVYFDKHPG